MPFKTANKRCEQCSKRLVLSSARDMERKRFCSHRCRQLNRFKDGDRPVGSKPVGILHAWSSSFVCALCESPVQNAHPKQKWCMECVPDNKWRHRARRYGIGKQQWNAMLAEQGGTCALCDSVPEVVDHDHASGTVRGLLCGSCNLKLCGLDDKDWFRRAKEYKRRA